MQSALPAWEMLLKKITWMQLGEVKNKRILDFGSGTGVTAAHYAPCNEVTAIEPDSAAVNDRMPGAYGQLTGSTDMLRMLPDAGFDLILCHNVLEYALDREAILQEFFRLLRKGGELSLIKHNRAGRVMQMAVLLDDFERANALLDGADSTAAQYGAIRYYDDEDVLRWCDGFSLRSVRGIRAFWDLQQNQMLHGDAIWQEKMITLEMRTASLEPYRSIAFFHHLLLVKERG